MRLPRDRWRFARQVALVAAGGALGGLLVVGLGQGRGAPFSLKPSAFQSGTTTTTTAPQGGGSLPATIGTPRFAAKPPTVQLASRLLPSDGVPAVALKAYEEAAVQLATADPSCRIDWEDLAGIGRVESDNGQTLGSAARVTATGTVFPPIYGPLLDGADGFAAIPSPDSGRLEGGGAFTRAVGPMQFLPSTWLAYAQSDIGDNPPNPQNFYDAALTAGRYLCANGGDLATPSGLKGAVYSYNHSSSYVTLVQEWVTFYTQEGTGALLTAGAGQLPVGVPAVGTESGGPGAATASLASAATATDAKGSFQLSFDVLSGQALVATGSAAVDVATSQASMTLQIDGLGTITTRLVGQKSYISLPPALARTVGAEGAWIVLSREVMSRLPALLEEGLGALQYDLPYVVAQLGAGSGVMQLEGKGYVNGVAATEYLGTIDLSVAAGKLPGARAALTDAAALLGGYQIGVDAWVDGQGLVQSETLALPTLPGSQGDAAFLVELRLSGFGTPVRVAVPPLSGVSSSTTTSSSSTTSTTSPSTSSSSTSTTTTSPTTTSSSTTTTTLAGPTGPSGVTGPTGTPASTSGTT